jgi:hypothetical protein
VVQARAADGYDQARFYDSPNNDVYVATPTYGGLHNDGGGQYNRAIYFDRVDAFATAGGVDIAKMFDGPGDDLFYADPDQGALYQPGTYYNRAKFFEAVHAYATAGGYDEAELHDSAGDDKFYADPIQGALFGQGYYNRAKHFEKVYAIASGGNDEAYLSDSASADLLEAREGRDGEADWAQLSNAAIDFLHRAAGFDYVKATATTSDNSLDVPQPFDLDFVLELEGPWPE